MSEQYDWRGILAVEAKLEAAQARVRELSDASFEAAEREAKLIARVRELEELYERVNDWYMRARDERDQTRAQAQELEDRIHDFVMPADDQERYGVTTYQEHRDVLRTALRELVEAVDDDVRPGIKLHPDRFAHALANARSLLDSTKVDQWTIGTSGVPTEESK